MVSEVATIGTGDLLDRGQTTDPGNDRRFQTRRSPRPQYLSSLVSINPVGAKSTESSGHLSLERLQSIVSQLQPGVTRRGLREMQRRRVLARVARELLPGMGRFDDAGGRGLRSQMAGHLRQVRRLLP